MILLSFLLIKYYNHNIPVTPYPNDPEAVVVDVVYVLLPYVQQNNVQALLSQQASKKAAHSPW